MPAYKIDKLLGSIFFTMYIGSGRSELAAGHLGNNTVVISDKFHS